MVWLNRLVQAADPTPAKVLGLAFFVVVVLPGPVVALGVSLVASFTALRKLRDKAAHTVRAILALLCIPVGLAVTALSVPMPGALRAAFQIVLPLVNIVMAGLAIREALRPVK